MDGITEAPGILAGPAAVVGETNAGEAAKAVKKVKQLIHGMMTNQFDLMDALHEVKTNKFYQPKYLTFVDFAKSLDLKLTKIYYMIRIRETMLAANVSRERFQPVGIAKLRLIASIDTTKEGQIDQAAVAKINEIIDSAVSSEPEAVRKAVAEFKGDIGVEAWTWLNVKVRESQKEVITQALELCKMLVGSTGTDAVGEAVDASDGRALELICGDWLADPNNVPAVAQLGKDEIVLVEEQ